MRVGKELFSQGNLEATLRANRASIPDRVAAIPRDQFMSLPTEEIAAHIESEMMIEPLIAYEDRAEMEYGETKIDVSDWPDRNHLHEQGPIYIPGITITVTIPFTGNFNLWHLEPNPKQMDSLCAEVVAAPDVLGEIRISLSRPADESQQRIKAIVDRALDYIRKNLEHQKAQIAGYNSALKSNISAAMKARRERLIKQEGLRDILGIPLKRKDGAPTFEPVKISRKLVRPLPPPPKSGFKPEPGISEEDYGHILSVIRQVGRTFETTPKTFSVHGEEALRDILLANLNGHYQGDAVGEAFRRNGKTDIRIEDNNRAAFVAECKIWRGAKELSRAIDQLLSYLTWRDCKTAIIIFNKHNAKFKEILEVIPGVFKDQRGYKFDAETKEQGEWEYVMAPHEDDDRRVRVHVFVLNIFAQSRPSS